MTAEEWRKKLGLHGVPDAEVEATWDALIADLAAAEERARDIQQEWDAWVLLQKGWIEERAAALLARDIAIKSSVDAEARCARLERTIKGIILNINGGKLPVTVYGIRDSLTRALAPGEARKGAGTGEA